MTFERFSDLEHPIPGCFCFAAPMYSVSGYEWFVSRCRPIMAFLRDPEEPRKYLDFAWGTDN